MKPSLNTTARIAGTIVGAGIALLILIGAKPSTETESALPARTSFEVAAPGELEVVPAAPEPLLAARELTPGGARALKAFSVRNQTGLRSLVGFSADADVRSLDGLLRVRLTSGSTVLADTTLGGLRNEPLSRLALAPGERGEIELAAWLPATVGDGYQGQRVDVSLLASVEPAR